MGDDSPPVGKEDSRPISGSLLIYAFMKCKRDFHGQTPPAKTPQWVAVQRHVTICLTPFKGIG
jgi:hypothetical protein